MTDTHQTPSVSAPVAWLLMSVLAMGPSIGTRAQEPSGPAADVNVRDTWVRESTATRTVSAAYMTIENRTAREITLVGVTLEGATRAEIHTVLHEHGRVGMKAVTEVRIPQRSSVELAPGGTHIMLFDVTPPLVRGGSLAMTLVFEGGHRQAITALVRPLGAASIR